MKTYGIVFQDTMDDRCKEFNDNLRSWAVLAVLSAYSMHQHAPIRSTNKLLFSNLGQGLDILWASLW